MSDLREQLLKAGLVSSRQVRQAKHDDRVHRKEVGLEGLQEERAAQQRAAEERLEAKRRADREREEERRRRELEQQRAEVLRSRIRGGWIREATAGAKRFFFVLEGGRITYLDLNDGAARRLLGGSAAIVDTTGAVRGEFCVIDGHAAQSLAREHPEIIRYWNRSVDR